MTGVEVTPCDRLDGRAGQRRFTGLEQRDLPERSAGAVVVGVEGVDAVVLSGDEEDVVFGAVDGEVGNQQRLAIGIAVDLVGEELAEGMAVTLAGVSDVSFGLRPLRSLSKCQVVTLTRFPDGDGDGERGDPLTPLSDA